jgi:copper(I)-binding protein
MRSIMPALPWSGRTWLRPSGRLASRLAPVLLAVALTAGATAGCDATAQPPGPPLSLMSAQVTTPNADGVTTAYLVVQNKGPAIQLLGARTSAGGTVALRSPARAGASVMQTVRAIVIPAHTLFRLDPAGSHLLITGSGPMKAGTEITLTLIFARGKTIAVPALVTNPATGGASYFLN